jgi:hypothetical protein
MKEALLGLLNGSLVGITAAAAMFVIATMQNHPVPLVLSLVVFTAMIGSCLVSGISGALVPLALKKLGADPTTASGIFLTTATDVVSMGCCWDSAGPWCNSPFERSRTSVLRRRITSGPAPARKSVEALEAAAPLQALEPGRWSTDRLA